MRKLDHDEERLKIAAVAARLIAKKGVQNLTTNDIAKEMDATRGKILHYFDNANAIVEAAFDWANAKAEQRMGEIAKSAEVIKFSPVIIYNILPFTEETDIEWKVRLSCWESAFSDEKQREFLVQQAKVHLAGISMIIAKAQSDNTIRNDIPPEELARLISDMMRGLALALLNLPLSERRERSSCVSVLTIMFAPPA